MSEHRSSTDLAAEQAAIHEELTALRQEQQAALDDPKWTVAAHEKRETRIAALERKHAAQGYAVQRATKREEAERAAERAAQVHEHAHSCATHADERTANEARALDEAAAALLVAAANWRRASTKVAGCFTHVVQNGIAPGNLQYQHDLFGIRLPQARGIDATFALVVSRLFAQFAVVIGLDQRDRTNDELKQLAQPAHKFADAAAQAATLLRHTLAQIDPELAPAAAAPATTAERELTTEEKLKHWVGGPISGVRTV